MSDFALIARADRGGISAQSWELHRHLHPRRVLLVDLGAKGRGPTDPSMYVDAPELRVTDGVPTREDAAWLARPGVESVFTIEGLYSDAVRAALAHSGVRVILQANPELYRPADLHGLNLEVVLPTLWEAYRFPEATRVLPVPVDTKALHPGLAPCRPEELVVFHPAGAAMADRNGTRLLLAALRHLATSAVVRVANRPDLPRKHMGRAVLRPVADMPSHLDHWRSGIDLLVLPRRYGGLCLPLQEAAACAIPIITTDLEPQRSWVPTAGLVRVVTEPARLAMKGGTFDVWACQPGELAVTIDRFLADTGLRLQAGMEARAYAETISWENLAPVYQELLLAGPAAIC